VRLWFYLLVGLVVMCMLWLFVAVGMPVLFDNNIVVLQNQSPHAIDLTIGVTDEAMHWQVHLPAQACTLVRFQVRGDSALTTTVSGFATEQSGYYTGSLGGVECLALPVGDCDIPALQLPYSALIRQMSTQYRRASLGLHESRQSRRRGIQAPSTVRCWSARYR
jgi:hypothetical protein